VLGLALASASLSSAIPALASPKDDARAAYDRGLAAHARGDEATAAREFAAADAIMPSDAAIEAAIESAAAADDPVLVVKLCQRADGRALDPQARKVVDEARRRFSPRVAQVRVDCAGASICDVSVDGGAFVPVTSALVLRAGEHVFVVDRDGARTTSTARAEGGGTLTLAPSTASPRREPRARDEVRAAPYVAIAGIGVTAVLGGLAIWSGLDARSTHEDFVAGRCGLDAPVGTTPIAGCGALADRGHAAQTRTNWLLAGTGVAALATLGYVIVARPFSSRVALSIGPTGASVALSFR
jgi:hypothetical protein